jgi:transcriptional regulator with XRE-family HTH domain
METRRGLRALRAAAGLSQDALAQKAGVGARTIARLEASGAPAPRKGTLEAIAAALEMTPTVLAAALAPPPPSDDYDARVRALLAEAPATSRPLDGDATTGGALPLSGGVSVGAALEELATTKFGAPTDRFTRFATADDGVDELLIDADRPLRARVDGVWRTVRDLVYTDAQVRAMAHCLGLSMSEKTPILDRWRLRADVLATATWPPTSRHGATLLIRPRRRRSTSLEELAAAGMLTPTAAAVLAHAVHRRRTVLVIGPPGSGKTTLAAALVREIPEGHRLVVLDAQPEITPHANSVRVITGRQPPPPPALFPPYPAPEEIAAHVRHLRADRLVVDPLDDDIGNALLPSVATAFPGSVMVATTLRGVNSLSRDTDGNGHAGELIAAANAASVVVLLARHATGPRVVDILANRSRLFTADAAGILRATERAVRWLSWWNEHLDA